MLSAIIVAAGRSQRLKTAASKPLIKIGRLPIIAYSLGVLQKHPKVNEIIIVVNRKNRQGIIRLIKKSSFKKVKRIVLGGKERQDSVYNGLQAVNRHSDWVLIHDAARPFISSRLVSGVISAAQKTGAAIAAVVPKATIKSCRGVNLVKETLRRNSLREVQTPQVFKKDVIGKAYKKYAGHKVTDDASLVEKTGQPVAVAEGSYKNIKITTSEDLLFAELIIKKE